MTDFYTAKKFNADHSTFGGIISNYDFDEHAAMTDIASKIASDLKFDDRCRRNIENRNRQHAIRRTNKKS